MSSPVCIIAGAAMPNPENEVLSPAQMAGLMMFTMIGSLGGPQSDEGYLDTFERAFDVHCPAPTLGDVKRAYLYDFPENMAEEEMKYWQKIWARVARAYGQNVRQFWSSRRGPRRRGPKRHHQARATVLRRGGPLQAHGLVPLEIAK